MVDEQIIRQAVLDALAEQNFYREPIDLANKVVFHAKAIESAIIEKRIWDNMIAVDLDKLEESYANGFETGRTWKEDYIPGGPFHYGAGEHESDRTKAMAEQTKAEHAAWMQGFHDGNGIEVGSRKPNAFNFRG